MDDTSIPESPVNEKGGGEDIVLRGALFFARRGFEVFPVDPKNKMPRKSERVSGTKWGKTTDPDEIRRDWGKWPDSNVGLATGPVSGFFVIDIDVKDNGFETWEKLTAERPPLPQTVTVETPTGGRHYWWRYPVAVDVKNSARTVVGPGVDVRGDGGFVVAPPSVKVDKFGAVVGPYRFMPGCSPVNVSVAEAPEWLLAAVRKKPKAARTTPARPPPEGDDAFTVEAKLKKAWKIASEALERIAAAPDGTRNDTLNREAMLIGGLAGVIDRDDLLFSIEEKIANWGDPEKTLDTLKRAFEAGIAQPLEIEFGASDAAPVYNLDRVKVGGIVWVHEGEEAAAYCQSLADRATPEAQEALLSHPWRHAVAAAVHVSWSGGTRPDHTNWAALAELRLEQIVIVPPNSTVGKEAVPRISKALKNSGAQIFWMDFDRRFPEGFDLGESFPERMWERDPKRGRVFVGPSLLDLLRPANWATSSVVLPKAKGQPGPAKTLVDLNPSFIQSWALVPSKRGNTVWNREYPRYSYSAAEFDTHMRAFSDSRAISSLLAEKTSAVFDEVCYRPAAERELTVEGRRMLNVYTSPQFHPPTDGDEDPGPFLEYLEHLIPDEKDRHLLKRWIATFIARPDIRMDYGVLLFSTTQGVGKTTLGDILALVEGKWNVSFIEGKTLTTQFNAYIAEKRLVFCNEIYDSESGWKLYNSLKSGMTDEMILINKKFEAEYPLENWTHHIYCSNHKAGLRIEDGDRRFLVPRVTEELKDVGWWREFRAWLEACGRWSIAHWAIDFVEENPENIVMKGERAPMTGRRQELIDDSKGEPDRRLEELAEAAFAMAETRKDLVVLHEYEVEGWLKQELPNNRLSLSHIRNKLEQAGMVKSKRTKVAGRAVFFLCTKPPGDGWSAGMAEASKVSPSEILESSM